jgi:excisionase family DNA binding protein
MTVKGGKLKNTPDLTPREAATRLGIGLQFIYQLLWSGKLPGKKTGKTWRIPTDAVDARLKGRS